jgi:UDP:flavonoid glycosyltransferase YjiC (YdhE family)
VLPAAPAITPIARLSPVLGRTMVRFAHYATRRWSEPVQALRAASGLARGRDPIFEGQFSPVLTLALFSPVFGAPQPDWPANTRTTGFVFYNGPDPLSPELEAFLAAGASPVVFTLGTSAIYAAGTFYQESAAAALRLGLRAVLLTGGFPENRPQTSSKDIMVIDGAPHQLLFPRAAAVVHQGGVGTTGQALRAGRPTIVVPHAHDQPDNASRVAALGVSRTIYPRAYRVTRVARELEKLLGHQDYRSNAERVGGLVRAENGARSAADAIGELG